MTDHAADAVARLRALDARQSFIVQAPAGSGKTGLLVQRMLLLLSLVDEPEEVLAITFTRKAAAEMRQRVVEALHAAQSRVDGAHDHERTTWRLAGQVLARSDERGWALLDYPNRLRIQTIDGLCGSIARQMPVMARAGSAMKTTERASELYEEAAQQLLGALDGDEPWAETVGELLLHLDNDWNKARDLVAAMLASREQWLRHLVGLADRPDAREHVERVLCDIVQSRIARFDALIPTELRDELLLLARFGAINVQRSNPESPLCVWAQCTTWPEARSEQEATWRALAVFLTTDSRLRKKAVEGIGFPPQTKLPDHEKEAARTMQRRYAALLTALQDLPNITAALHDIETMPPPRYSDAQWHFVCTLSRILQLAVAHLRVVFQQRGTVDFGEVAQAAARALGNADEPTDLALALDYRISHILVDEFQDTSFGQFALLQALTAGWQPDDGRTVFLVGDPMQSIYRFREAQVGLFLWARQFGLGHIALESVNLSVNFRSTAPLVDWFNTTFRDVLPATEDAAEGAVPYSTAHASPGAGEHGGVRIHALPDNNPVTEAARVVDVIQRERAANPTNSIAVLVQTRSAVSHIAAALRAAAIPMQAVDIERLTSRPVVQDLLALTRALLHPADRTAWYAVLRAPWCAIGTKALLDIADTPASSVIEAVGHLLRAGGCAKQDHQRLESLQAVLTSALADRARLPLRRWVETTWWRLGGPACIGDLHADADAERFFSLLDRIDEEHGVRDANKLAQRVDELYASNADHRDAVQVMTIHKAKGLQFDVVVVPGLGRRSRRDDKRLLLWQEQLTDAGASELLLAPLAAAGESQNVLYRYVESVEKRKSAHERGRLMYVAATRACRTLHLFGHAPLRGDDQAPRPSAESFLGILWPAITTGFVSSAATASTNAAVSGAAARGESAMPVLIPGQVVPPPPDASPVARVPLMLASVAGVQTPIEFLWATPTAMAIGTVVHRLLRQIATDGLDAWHRDSVVALLPRLRHSLRLQSVTESDLDWAARRVVEAVTKTLSDPRGRWLLDKRHRESACEWSVTGVVEGSVRNLILDRYFVDEEGVRWVIDYKTGSHSGSDVEAFLDNELARYRQQIERYVTLLQTADDRPIRAALYFPLLQGWREWQRK